MSKAKSYYQRFTEMTDEQRNREVEQFDQEFIADQFKPLTSEQRRRWNKLLSAMKTEHRKKLVRPKKKEGTKVISLRVEKNLVSRADAAARQNGLTRAELVARGLELAPAKLPS